MHERFIERNACLESKSFGPVSDINISKKTTISGIFDEMAEFIIV